MEVKNPPTHLTCKICNEEKEIQMFPRDKGAKYQHKRICLNPCYKLKNQAYYQTIKGPIWKSRYAKPKEVVAE